MSISAKQLPEVRHEMLAHHNSEAGRSAYFGVVREVGLINRNLSEDQISRAYLAESMRWTWGELFYVTADMTALARAAALTMPDFTLRAEDVPCDFGVMRFETPVGEQSDGKYVSKIKTVVWGIIPEDVAAARAPGVWLSYYTDDNDLRDHLKEQPGIRKDFDRAWAVSRAGCGPLIYDNEAAIWFTDDPVPLPDGVAGGTEAAVLCTWLLMQQEVASVEHVRVERPVRRRLARLGVEAAPVRYVYLRRRASAGTGDGSGREYHHQWAVRGHWRRQWYPSQERHVPIWITPYIKGPEGAPLIGGEKVHVWNR